MAAEEHYPYQRARQILTVVFLLGSTYLLADTVNVWVADSLALPVNLTSAQAADNHQNPDLSAAPDSSQRLVQDIMASGLFLLPPPPKEASATASAAPPPPPLNVASKVSLVGVVMGFDGNQRAVLEEVPSKKQTMYRLSQRVQDVGELAAIEKDRVLFREGMQEEWLDLAIVKQTASAGRFPLPDQQQVKMVLPVLPLVQLPPGRRSIDRAQLAQLVSNPQSYFAEARFQPHFSGSGQLDGFKVDGIRQVGVLEKAGLQNDDVLAGINGMEIRDPAKLWETFRQLRHERVVRLNVVRQSQPMTLTVEIRG